MRERSEDPVGAQEKAAAIMLGPVPAEGDRHDTLVELAFRLAEAGATNEMLVANLDATAQRWRKYPDVYDRTSRVLALVKLVRGTYRNGPNGRGWRP